MSARGPIAALAVSSALSLAACHLFEDRDDSTPADHEAELDPADYAEQVDAKLRRISACRDIVASVIVESWERYADQVDDEGKPARKREGVYLRGINSNVFRSCRRVLEAAKTPPQMPKIEAEVTNVVEAGSRYAELTRELATYLEQEGWRDDGWETLSALDPQLRQTHGRWAAADDELQRAIDQRHIENDSILLGVLERRRSSLEVASRRVMIRARPLVRCMTGAARSEGPVETCANRYAAFDEAVASFDETYARDPGAASKVFWMQTFAKDVEEFHELANAFQRRLTQRKPRSSDVQELTDLYSSLVRDAETLDFDFP